MESLGTGRKGAQRGRKGQNGAQRGAKGQERAERGRKGQKEAQRGRKGQKEAEKRLFPFLSPFPAIPSLVPLKKVKRA